jgi:protocatechuate 3,4-dioxygenase alpha subunit
VTLPTTPSQTVGPYLHIGLTWADGPYAVAEGTPGAGWLRGRITDGAGNPVVDGLVETWQADAAGRFDHADDPRGAVPAPAGFRGFGRAATDANGEYAILTVKPGAIGDQAPHIDMSVFARGLLHRVVTRVYFADEAAANAADPVLATVPADRRDTLVAERTEDGYRLDIQLQGENETVFFAI